MFGMQNVWNIKCLENGMWERDFGKKGTWENGNLGKLYSLKTEILGNLQF